MKSHATILAIPLLVLGSAPTGAHGVATRVERHEVFLVEVRTHDGRPLADARFDVMPVGATQSVQSGRTDAAGRAAILPDPHRELEVRIASADGHGAKLRLAPPAPPDTKQETPGAPPTPLPAAPPPAAPAASPGGESPAFAWRDLLAGFGIVFGLFGLLQMRQRRNAPRH